MLLVFFVNIFLLILIRYVRNQFGIEDNTISIKESGIPNNMLMFAFVSTVFTPFVEEVAFRLPLVKSKYYFYSLIPLTLFIFLDYLFLKIGIICLVGLMVGNYYYPNKIIKILLALFSIVIFTLIHIANYTTTDIEQASIFNLVVLFLPQLVLGIATTIIRFTCFFWATVIYHSFYNLTILFIYS